MTVRETASEAKQIAETHESRNENVRLSFEAILIGNNEDRYTELQLLMTVDFEFLLSRSGKDVNP